MTAQSLEKLLKDLRAHNFDDAADLIEKQRSALDRIDETDWLPSRVREIIRAVQPKT